ncbi:hypothetical protein [Streptomyces sp. NPDC059783]|uniref:hypothetical protein n=1 Tax=Streptomyces sp. NPDC059783 TaxID=3346944 RepID=UPI003649FF6D
MSDTVRDLLASIDDVLGDASAQAPAPAAVVTPEAEAPERRSTVTEHSVRDSMVRQGLVSQRPVPPMPPLPPAVPPHLALSQAQADLDQRRGQDRGDADQVTEGQGAEGQDQGAEETSKKAAWWWSKPGAREEAAPEEAAPAPAVAASAPAQAAPVVAVPGGAPTGGAPATAPKGPNQRLRWLAYNGMAGTAGSVALWSLTGDPMEGAALVGQMSASVPQMTAAGLALGAAYVGWRAGGLLSLLLPVPAVVGRAVAATAAALWGAGTAPLLADVLAESGPWGALLSPALATAPLAAAVWHGLDRRAAGLAPPVRWAARIPLATLTLSALLYAPGALL